MAHFTLGDAGEDLSPGDDWADFLGKIKSPLHPRMAHGVRNFGYLVAAGDSAGQTRYFLFYRAGTRD